MQNKFLLHNDEVREKMLSEIGLSGVDELFKNIDGGIRLREELDLPKGLNEIEVYG